MAQDKDLIEATTLQRLRQDPDLLALEKQIMAISPMVGSNQRGQGDLDALKQRNALIAQYQTLADQKGLLPKDYAVSFADKTGEPSVDHQNWLERNQQKVLLGAAAGLTAAPFVAPGLFGGGAAASGGAGTGTTAALPSVGEVGSTVGSVGTPVSIAAPSALPTVGEVGSTIGAVGTPVTITAPSAATTAPAVAGGTQAVSAGTKFANFLKNPYVQVALGAGPKLVSDVLNYRAQGKAVDATKEATDKALQLQEEAAAEAKRVAERQYADKAPYREAGSAATLNLAALMGLQAPPQAAAVPAAPSSVSTSVRTPTANAVQTGRVAVPRGTTLGAASGVSTTRVRAPNGNIYMVPGDRVQEAISQGGQVVS